MRALVIQLDRNIPDFFITFTKGSLEEGNIYRALNKNFKYANGVLKEVVEDISNVAVVLNSPYKDSQSSML